MKTIKQKGLLFAFLLTLILPAMGFSQTVREALEQYNQGATLIQENPEKALEHLYAALEISEELDFEGREAKELTESLIPRAHLQLAMNLYRAQQMYEAIEQLEKARETGQAYFDRNTVNRVERIIPQLYNQMGNSHYRADEFDRAISYYKKAFDIKSDYPDPLWGISLSYEKMEDFDSMLKYLKKTMDVAHQVNDRQKAEDSQRKAKNYLLRQGDEAQKDKKHEEAVEWFKKTLDYDTTDGAVYFVLAVNHSELKNWGKVVEFTKLAIENANGLDEAGVYFQMGVAYQNLGNNSEACRSFSRAATGSFRESAEYKMKEELNCN